MATKPLTCLIIEDEPIAAEVIQDYIEQIAFLELRGICQDAIFAMDHVCAKKLSMSFSWTFIFLN